MQQDLLQVLFSAIDIDNDGEITSDELHRCLQFRQAHYSPVMIENYFQQADTDGNGKIDFHEFQEFMKKL